jgi:hypothetical protein
MKEQTTAETRLIRKVFLNKFGVKLTLEQLEQIDIVYFSEKRERVYDIGIYRGINLCLFFILFIVAMFLTDSWFFKIVLLLLTFYNAVHLFQTIKKYKALDRDNR